MEFQVTGHFSGVAAPGGGILHRTPWLYVIAATRHRLLYIGETYDVGGLAGRVSTQLGPWTQSTFRQAARRIVGLGRVAEPFVVLGVDLSPEDQNLPWDAGSKVIRLAVEAQLHDLAVRLFLPSRPGWKVISSPSPTSMALDAKGRTACDALFTALSAGLSVASDLSATYGFQLLIVRTRSVREEDSLHWRDLLDQFETELFGWIRGVLRKALGEEKWWSDGIPAEARKKCVVRREEDKAAPTVPPETYLDLMDLREIVQANWSAFEKVMHEISGEQGKKNATDWIRELNETRRIAAHPIRRTYFPLQTEAVARVRAQYAIFCKLVS